MTNLCNCLLEVSGDNILAQGYDNTHIYTNIQTQTLTYIRTHLHTYIKFCLQYIEVVVW